MATSVAATSTTTGALRALRKLIIFDLNGTLIARELRRLGKRKPDYEINGKNVWLRPALAPFLDFCVEHFEVGVWSSAMKVNVEPIVRTVFGERKLLFHLDRAATVKDRSAGVRSHATLKDLRVVWRQFPQYGPANTVIVDDSVSKSRLNPANAIWVPDFNAGTMTHEAFNGDAVLPQLQQYLAELVDAADVRVVLRERPFLGGPPLAAPAVDTSLDASLDSGIGGGDDDAVVVDDGSSPSTTTPVTPQPTARRKVPKHPKAGSTTRSVDATSDGHLRVTLTTRLPEAH